MNILLEPAVRVVKEITHCQKHDAWHACDSACPFCSYENSG